MSKRLLTLADAGDYLGISRARMYQLVKAGEVKSVHVGKLHRIAVEELDVYVSRLQRAEARSRRSGASETVASA